ncbi:hypothetical protein MK416_01170 [Streptococcus oralis]|uniref:hypothetical protein n=1 Tax=Streptococcus oralis TaxID=1303 RepID=UPI0022842F27|nr:hypothetical protein [Streptococcus oralis]MCY7071015.1 hypothetical protein [Streptococcus oralis]
MSQNGVPVMIPIEKSNTSKVEKFCLELYKKMNFRHYPEFKDELNNWVVNNIPGLESEQDAFLKIMSADYLFLEECKKLLNNFIVNEPKLTEYLKKSYDKIDSQLRKKIIDLKNISVCPYCNRNYINSTYKVFTCNNCNQDLLVIDGTEKECPGCKQEINDQTKVVNTAQLDHFFSKDSYPLFAVSFYNLIPSCYSCNHVKSNKDIKYSPYDTSFPFDNVKFTYVLKSADEIEIKINSHDSDFKNGIRVLGIEELYQGHIDVVNELIWKKEVYTDSYRDGLSKILDQTNLALNKAEVNRFITGYYTDKENYGNRPLSKMVTDISKEIGLVGEEE